MTRIIDIIGSAATTVILCGLFYGPGQYRTLFVAAGFALAAGYVALCLWSEYADFGEG